MLRLPDDPLSAPDACVSQEGFGRAVVGAWANTCGVLSVNTGLKPYVAVNEVHYTGLSGMKLWLGTSLCCTLQEVPIEG